MLESPRGLKIGTNIYISKIKEKDGTICASPRDIQNALTAETAYTPHTARPLLTYTPLNNVTDKEVALFDFARSKT